MTLKEYIENGASSLEDAASRAKKIRDNISYDAEEVVNLAEKFLIAKQELETKLNELDYQWY